MGKPATPLDRTRGSSVLHVRSHSIAPDSSIQEGSQNSIASAVDCHGQPPQGERTPAMCGSDMRVVFRCNDRGEAIF
jgi:hypothetical protein